MKLFRVLAASLSVAALFAGTELASGKSAYAAVLPTSDNNKQEKVMTVDDFQIVRNEKIGYKIREAQHAKIPYMLVIGDKEAEAGTVAVRIREGGEQSVMPLDEFAAKITGEIKSRT